MSLILLTCLIVAAPYALPDPAALPRPDAAAQIRIERALATLRDGAGDEVDAAVRELALVGEPALHAVLERLNRAPPGERLLLLTAVRRLERATPLLEQARRDPNAAVRTCLAAPPARPEPDLRLLARRYLDLLALAERKLRLEADADAANLPEPLARPTESFASLRGRMKDRRLADDIQARRRRAATRFALAGARALRAGRLRPDLRDPVFLAFLGLLREEESDSAFYFALTALAGAGPELAPVLVRLLERPQHDPRKILRLLFAVSPRLGAALYDRFDAQRPDVQRALVGLARSHLAPARLAAFLERAALSPESSVRRAALDALLGLEPPAGRDVARRLLDPALYGDAEFARAARLLARCGEIRLLEEYATIELKSGEGRIESLHRLQRAARAALKEHSTPATEALGARLLGSDREELRMFGIDLVRDPQALLRRARTEPEKRLATAAAERALELGGPELAEPVLGIVKERGLRTYGTIQALEHMERVDLLLRLAGAPDTGTRRAALFAIGGLERVDPRYEAALLALARDAVPALRDAALRALVPLGTEAARRLLLDAGDEAIEVLFRRVESSLPIAFGFPLERFVAGADAARLKRLGWIADGLPETGSGLFLALLEAWDALPVGERDADGLEGSAALQKTWLLDALARSRDVASAQALFDALVSGDQRDPDQVLGILKAAARLLPPDQLVRLVPLLEAQVRLEHALRNKQPPPEANRLRYRLLRGCIRALAHGGVTKALGPLCDILLDPELYDPAYDWKYESPAPWWVLEALRLFPADAVDAAFRAALARAERDGRLARLHPGRLRALVGQCRQGRRNGRWLAEVALALVEVLDRLPHDLEDTAYQRMLALGALKRYAEAAAAGRRAAAEARAGNATEEDGFWTPRRLEARAELYEALHAGDPARIAKHFAELEGDPILLYTAGWYTLFYVRDVALAERAARAAVRGTAGLHHTYRDLLAAVRLQQGRPGEALFWLDPERTLPVRRRATSGWHLVWQAKARLALGDELRARFDLENALRVDRRVLATARSDPSFARFPDVFETADREFFEAQFALDG